MVISVYKVGGRRCLYGLRTEPGRSLGRAPRLLQRPSGRGNASLPKTKGTRRLRAPLEITKTNDLYALAARLTPASDASSSALSVFSQENSGSLRPKWP